MSAQKKFGAFDGVFTPSILTILGVIMYLRMGWVVGNAGLWGTIVIVVIAHLISFSTGLSISSISTDKKVGAGGVYYVLSRSLGLPIGGAIGLTLFIGTALSIALYLVGFSESFNAYIGLSADVNGLRSTGSLFLLLLTIIAFISTSVAIKTQFFILTAIVLSLVSIFVGGGGATPNPVAPFGGEGVAPMETVFAIFFPAVTGFTAGIAMSGDLANPKKDIPLGTIASIVVGFIVYIILAFFLSYKIDAELLRTDYNVLVNIAYFGPAVIAGIWGATLSSAIGGILGGPRILQAMSLDRITPRIFGKGVGASNEPRNALILTVIIAEGGILIGELDLIARLVSMFYLAAYGFINISFFLESWASSDFKPSFKVSRWVGLIGFVATFAVMFKLDMLAMVAALILIGGIFLWLQRKQISLGTGDVWQSVWSTVVKSGLKRMEVAEDHKRNWKPNVMLFSGNSEARPHLIEFSKALAGQVGMVTNFDLVENDKAAVLFPKHKQNVSDELLQKYGVFGRRIEVNNVYKGIETIATTFGFSGLDPNTVLMGWAKNTQDPIWFAQMTEKLIALDYNVLYLDYDKRWGFRKREQIDMWWRGISNNAELMLHLARFISSSPGWRNARIRVLLVNDFNVDRRMIENRIQLLLDEFRVSAEIKVINNTVDRKPFYELMKTASADADLIFIGIPDIKEGKEASFVQRTNELISIIGTTLLVKASSTFETTELGLRELEQKEEASPEQDRSLPALQLPESEEFSRLSALYDREAAAAMEEFSTQALSVLQQHYRQWLAEQEALLYACCDQLEKDPFAAADILQQSLSQQIRQSQAFCQEELTPLRDVLEESIRDYRRRRAALIAGMPVKVLLPHPGRQGKQRKVPLRQAFSVLDTSRAEHSLLEALRGLGLANANLVVKCGKASQEIHHQLSVLHAGSQPDEEVLAEARKMIAQRFKGLRRRAGEMLEWPAFQLRSTDRESANWLAKAVAKKDFARLMRRERKRQKKKELRETLRQTEQFSSFWERNQLLIHHNYETGLQLAQTALVLKASKEAALRRLREGYVLPLIKDIQNMRATVEQLAGQLQEGAEGLPEHKQLPQQESDYNNTETVQWAYVESVKYAHQHLPEKLELMDEDSRNNFRQQQGDTVSTISLSLAEIAAYLIDSGFTSPFQEQLLRLRQQLNRVAGRANNQSSLVNYGLESTEEPEHRKELSAILKQAGTELLQLEEVTQTAIKSVEAELKEKYEATEAALRIESIVAQAEELSQYVRKESRRRGLTAWRNWVQEQFSGAEQEVRQFITRRQEDVAAAAFRESYEPVRSDQDRLRAFWEGLQPKPEVAALPFYYRQLFSGKHINLSRKSDVRRHDMQEAVKVLRYIRSGIPGALMVTGEALCGKSFFLERLARQELGGIHYRVIPPPGGSGAPRALQRAFEQACEQRGSIANLLQRMPQGSIFVLEDVELWWLQHQEGSAAIEQLIDTVRRFSPQHTFLLSANLDALRVLREHTSIDRALAGTVALGPLPQHQLKHILKARHQTGGVQMQLLGKTEEELQEKDWDKVSTRLHRTAKGNIGRALQQWLLQIEPSGKNLDLVTEVQPPDFPELEDASWYFLLLQLYIHRALTRRRMYRLFAGEGEEWIENRIDQLRKSMILQPHGRDIIELQPLIRYELGQLLKERSLL